MEQADKKRLFNSLIFPGILIILLWIIKAVEVIFKVDFSEFGLFPQHLVGLRGIIFSPLLHGSWAHLSANSVPLFVLLSGLFYYYEKVAYRILALLWIMTGIWVWVFAKDTGIHIGASGIVYALAAFHFTSGILRREPRMMAFSLLVVFLYGGLIWGIIPNIYPDKNISWESHLLGLLAGFILSFFYKPYGFQRKEYVWDDEEEGEEPNEEPIAQNIDDLIIEEHPESIEEQKPDIPIKFNYHITKPDPGNESKK
jgi:membrane associated rhomboid family serine protease